MQRVTRDPRVAAVRAAIQGESRWIMFLLRLSPLVPYNILNYALALSGVRYVDFLDRADRHDSRDHHVHLLRQGGG